MSFCICLVYTSQSLGPLFSHAQWFALKNAGPKQLDELERLCLRPETLPPYVMVRHVRLIYGALNNDLLLRLVWQAFLFYQAPFLSLPENLAAFEDGDGPLLDMIGLCRRKDWNGLWQAVAAYQNQLTSAIRQFYADRIAIKPDKEPVSFYWNSYEKSSQRCYSCLLYTSVLESREKNRQKMQDIFYNPAQKNLRMND